jgi:transcriptional regulator PpsR
VKDFTAPKKSLGALDAEAAARLLTAASDVALVLDGNGVIRDLAFGSDELPAEGYAQWLGQPWTQTVTVESRPKVEALLKDAAESAAPTWRHVNHPSSHGGDVPILYSAIKVGKSGAVVAIGRNLRALSVLQQRLIEAQQSLERDYVRLRHAETRYRLLFQMASEAVLIVDAANQKVVEANPAALRMLGNGSKHVVGRQFPEGFDAASTRAVATMLAAVRAAGRADDVRVRMAGGGASYLVSASLFRHDQGSQFLVRLAPVDAVAGAAPSPSGALQRAIENLPDGFVVTEPDGRVLSANRAFLDLVQLAAEDQVRGRSLDDWLGRPRVDLNVLVANLRQHGVVRLFSTSLRGEFGENTDVEISAVSVPDGERPCLGFSIRNVARRIAPPAARASGELPRSVEQLTELIGKLPLKDIVRETADVIERLCIEAALELTGDNRASAAEMLGLSRQSLYVKMRRYGLGDLEPDAD